MAEKEATERRVYVLPADLLERIRAFQEASGIASETEAARRLLDSALQMRDSVETILKTLAARFADERDLRVLAGDILARHALVTKVAIGDDEVSFEIRAGDKGRISRDGSLYKLGREEPDDYWHAYEPPRKFVSKKTEKLGGGWDADGTVSSDLDDEIPF